MSERPPISPRSPRAALEPEQVPPPPRRSDRARNPLVVFGNAVITIVLILMIGAGGFYVYGKKMMESPGPLAEDKTVNIPPRSKTREIAETLQREGVIGWTFRQSPFQRRAGVVTAEVVTAAGRGGYPLLDAAADDAVTLADAVTPGLLTPFRRA